MAKEPLDYAREIANSSYYGSTEAYRGEDRLRDMWMRLPLDPYILPPAWRFHCVIVRREAIAYLYQNQDTANMLDLPQSVLKSMALMGSKAALMYYPFGQKDIEP